MLGVCEVSDTSLFIMALIEFSKRECSTLSQHERG
jgi:hypothetical protein